MKRCETAVVALVVGMCAGCGTVLNLGVPKTALTPDTPQLEVYGGVSDSLKLRGLAIADHQGDAPNLTAAALTVDVGLSAVGDTLTLPITVTAWVVRHMAIFAAACRGEI